MIEEIPFNTCQGSDAAQQSAEWIGGLHNTAHMKCVNLAGAYREIPAQELVSCENVGVL